MGRIGQAVGSRLLEVAGSVAHEHSMKMLTRLSWMKMRDHWYRLAEIC